MKNQHLTLIALSTLLAVPASAQKVDWDAVKATPPGTLIGVLTNSYTSCSYQSADDEKLSCTLKFPGSNYQGVEAERVFNRTDIREFHAITLSQYLNDDQNHDYSKGSLVLLLAAQGGGGWDLTHQATSFGGVKIGILGASMDLQYDRLAGQNGFAIEGSGILPLFRVPRFHPGNNHLAFKVFAEPGLGYRAGAGPFGQYASGKVLILFGPRAFLSELYTMEAEPEPGLGIGG
jgi:hypothetical protein